MATAARAMLPMSIRKESQSCIIKKENRNNIHLNEQFQMLPLTDIIKHIHI